MERKNFLIFLLFFISFPMQTIEYVYPVASLDENTILLIQQKTVDNITLWFLDKKTNHVKPGLWSRFNPASLCLLPDKSGFSFIDNGLLKIKFFNKRSPKTIPFDEPLYDITKVEWINNSYCYASAKKNNNFGIFQLSIEGDVDCIVKIPFTDCLYPQKVEDILFYIERTNNNYRIVSTSYPKIRVQNKYNCNDNNSFNTPMQKIIDKQILLDFKRQPIAFLHMKSANEGFVLEYDSYIDTKDDTILFSYLHLTKVDNHWHYKQLFSFAIPASFLLSHSPTRLYESILPLLPRHMNNAIYYADVRRQKNLNIFCYDLALGTTEQKTFSGTKKEHKDYFAPFLMDEQLIVGGKIDI